MVRRMKQLRSLQWRLLSYLIHVYIFSDFVQEFMGVKKPDKAKVKNPTGVRPKGLVVPGGSDHVVGGLRVDTSGSVSV
ncbi:hypothetical protein Tco_1535428 [Tanacetum coccineum]